MDQNSEQSPRWQLDSIFPGLDSPEYAAARQKMLDGVSELEAMLEAGLGDDVATLERVINLDNSTYATFQDVLAYVYLINSTDAFNDEAMAVRSSLMPAMVRYGIVETKLSAWIGTLDLERLLPESQLLRDHEFTLRMSARASSKLMEPAAEEVAAALAPTGGSAWSELHTQLISRETITVDVPGQGEQELGIAGLYNLQ